MQCKSKNNKTNQRKFTCSSTGKYTSKELLAVVHQPAPWRRSTTIRDTVKAPCWRGKIDKIDLSDFKKFKVL